MIKNKESENEHLQNGHLSHDRLSMRKSVLVWVAGMFVGWGIAVVLVY